MIINKSVRPPANMLMTVMEWMREVIKYTEVHEYGFKGRINILSTEGQTPTDIYPMRNFDHIMLIRLYYVDQKLDEWRSVDIKEVVHKGTKKVLTCTINLPDGEEKVFNFIVELSDFGKFIFFEKEYESSVQLVFEYVE